MLVNLKVAMFLSESKAKWVSEQSVHIKIALSSDKVCLLVNILTESH